MASLTGLVLFCVAMFKWLLLKCVLCHDRTRKFAEKYASDAATFGYNGPVFFLIDSVGM